MYSTLDIERQGQIATVWMNRPKVFNAFNEVLIEEIDRAFAELNDDNGVRIVVLGGRGPHFSAGADLNWMKKNANLSEADNTADAKRLAKMLYRIAQMQKPTVARVQGAALGGGTGLTAACDIAIASDNASFATSEVKFGIIPATISPYLLRAIGPRQALRYFQSAEKMTANKAQEIGLVHEVCALEKLDEMVKSITDALLLCGGKAQNAAKELIRDICGQKINAELIDETAHRIAKQRATDEAREGFAAFFEKRTPNW